MQLTETEIATIMAEFDAEGKTYSADMTAFYESAEFNRIYDEIKKYIETNDISHIVDCPYEQTLPTVVDNDYIKFVECVLFKCERTSSEESMFANEQADYKDLTVLRMSGQGYAFLTKLTSKKWHWEQPEFRVEWQKNQSNEA